MSRKRLSSEIIFGVGALLGIAAARVLRSFRFELAGKTVFISGGSRGLGLLLAHEFASRGARVAISGRDRGALDRAVESLLQAGAEALPVETDISIREEAELAVDQIRRKFGSIDILVNNAGTICVGPMEAMSIDDYRNSLNTHFWGPYFATMAVLPEMQRRRQGRIVNISSIGGKISVPHLLPYSVGKFALTGFSEGLRSEALKDNVYVTTVCPGLMRTGSPRNAFFKGNNKAEYAWFSISDSIPVLSMSARRAARQIVDACVCGNAEVVLSLPAKFAVKVHGLFPGTTANVLGVVNRLLPSAQGDSRKREPKTGKESFSEVSPSWVTTLNERAAEQNNQVP
ncbi:MAG TPA: SDR family NAD(P)-dependent oxidoreductase [Candidatus Sulfotelmatobacter sp.]|nr:SDR family NAD(P)-dependent oxidoreductase [Candidatus Sulfotelmatobacter sp.]